MIVLVAAGAAAIWYFFIRPQSAPATPGVSPGVSPGVAPGQLLPNSFLPGLATIPVSSVSPVAPPLQIVQPPLLSPVNEVVASIPSPSGDVAPILVAQPLDIGTPPATNDLDASQQAFLTANNGLT